MKYLVLFVLVALVASNSMEDAADALSRDLEISQSGSLWVKTKVNETKRFTIKSSNEAIVILDSQEIVSGGYEYFELKCTSACVVGQFYFFTISEIGSAATNHIFRPPESFINSVKVVA